MDGWVYSFRHFADPFGEPSSSLDPIVASPSGIDSTDYLQFMSTSQLLQIDLTCWCKRVQPVLRFWSCRASLKRLNVDGNFGLLALPTL